MAAPNTQLTVLFTSCAASPPRKAPPSLTVTLTRTSAQRLLAMQQEEGASVSTLSIVSYLPPPTGGVAGGIGVPPKRTAQPRGQPRPGGCYGFNVRSCGCAKA